jgi:hypothetical protein
MKRDVGEVEQEQPPGDTEPQEHYQIELTLRLYAVRLNRALIRSDFMSRRATRLLIMAGVPLTAIGIVGGFYYLSRLHQYVPDCEFCTGPPIPPDVAMQGDVFSMIFTFGGVMTVSAIAMLLRARRVVPRTPSNALRSE